MAFGVSRDMDLTALKVTPHAVVKQVLSAIETGLDEMLADDMSRQVKAGVSNQGGIYLSFDPEQSLDPAR